MSKAEITKGELEFLVDKLASNTVKTEVTNEILMGIIALLVVRKVVSRGDVNLVIEKARLNVEKNALEEMEDEKSN